MRERESERARERDREIETRDEREKDIGMEGKSKEILSNSLELLYYFCFTLSRELARCFGFVIGISIMSINRDYFQHRFLLSISL